MHGGTTRGGDLLVSSTGYGYTRQADPRPGRKQRWWCTNRNKQCGAKITEEAGAYVPNDRPHNCEPQPG